MARTRIAHQKIREFIGIYLPLSLAALFGSAPLNATESAGTNASALDGAWFLESNMANLDPSNRFLGSLVATNPGKGPIFLRVSVNRLELVDGVRKVSPDPNGALRALPHEFVLRPGESFPVRLLVDLGKQKVNSQSYYVNIEDVSNVAPDPDRLKGAMAGGVLLAYEALVSIQKTPVDTLTEDNFALKRAPNGQLSLTNLSGQHIYLNRGDACPDTKTVLVDCTPVEEFPRQTVLPMETLTFPDFKEPVLGMLVYPKLNTRSRATLLYLKVPPAQQ